MSPKALQILIVPDSFKGSLTARQFCDVASQALQDRLKAVDVTVIPMSDGGEGFLECFYPILKDQIEVYNVLGAHGAQRNCPMICDSSSQTAIIEMAEPCGLHWLPTDDHDPWKTTSYGLGSLIKEAAMKGCKEIILGIGGSSTNDGGAGALLALGATITDSDGQTIPFGAAGLKKVARIELDGIDPRVRQLKVICATDVGNTLLGPDGATYVFAHQKGARETDLQPMESSMNHWAQQLQKASPQTIPASSTGTGAGGGIAFGLSSALNCHIESGFSCLSRWHGWDQMLRGSWDLLITGEGCIDHQSANGKLISHIGQAGQKHCIPVVAFAGQIAAEPRLCEQLGLSAAFSVCNKPMTLETSKEQAVRGLYNAVWQAAGLFTHNQNKPVSLD